MAHLAQRSGGDPDAARFEAAIARLARARSGALIAVLPQLSRYSLVSALALALDFTVYLALMKLAMDPPLAGAIGYALGTGLHYLLSTRFVFDARATDKVHARLFGEFALSGIAGMGITALVIALATEAAGLAALPAKVLAAAASFVIVFGLRRAVVFSPRSFRAEHQPDHGRA
jgi:putative flippase GtrA